MNKNLNTFLENNHSKSQKKPINPMNPINSLGFTKTFNEYKNTQHNVNPNNNADKNKDSISTTCSFDQSFNENKKILQEKTNHKNENNLVNKMDFFKKNQNEPIHDSKQLNNSKKYEKDGSFCENSMEKDDTKRKDFCPNHPNKKVFKK